jgi:hypothetical protein
MGLRGLLLKGIAVIVVGVIGTLFVLHENSSVHAGIVIDRPPADVWSVVSNSTAYSDWNPFITRVDGDFRERQSALCSAMDRIRWSSSRLFWSFARDKTFAGVAVY